MQDARVSPGGATVETSSARCSGCRPSGPRRERFWSTSRKLAVRTLVVVHPHADLFEVVGALRPPPRRLARRLHRRQEQRNEDGDDGDHH